MLAVQVHRVVNGGVVLQVHPHGLVRLDHEHRNVGDQLAIDGEPGAVLAVEVAGPLPDDVVEPAVGLWGARSGVRGAVVQQVQILVRGQGRR